MCDKVDINNEKILNIIKDNGCFEETLIVDKCLKEYRNNFGSCQKELVILSNCKNKNNNLKLYKNN